MNVRAPASIDGADRSTRAVTLVDLRQAKLESSDMGTVLSRSEGVNVQRAGGLGSEARFSLAGFDESQVRFFIDGVPLEFSGYPFGFQNVPVAFGEKIEIHKGVLPIQFGADALGGAFNLVTDRATAGTRAFASYELGSFGYQRFSSGLRHRDAATGLFGKAEAFVDHSNNDYPVFVDVADRTGLITEQKVYRFHDRYDAAGGNVEVGVVDRSWAKRLLLRGFVTEYAKDIQNNVIMTVPYGEAREGALSSGAHLRYENGLADGIFLRAVAGYVHTRTDFLDTTECIYNWFGQCANQQVVPGEIGFSASDVSLWDNSGFLRGSVDWEFLSDHRLRFATSPTLLARTGDNRLVDGNDAHASARDMLKWVNGLEEESHFFDGAFSNQIFAKSYVQQLWGTDTYNGVPAHFEATRVLWGYGDGLRYDFTSEVFAKASYEWATRLPEAVEVFGNGGFIVQNMSLNPERSHNANLTLAVDELPTLSGRLDGNVTGFFRDADNLIVLLPLGDTLQHQNVYEAEVWGVEGSFAWLSPGDYLQLGGNVTYQSLRNTSGEGALSAFEGERIPNKPYFWTNGHIRLQERDLASTGDSLSFTWRTRFVHDFYINWEGAGRKGPDDSVPSQLLHSAVLTYVTPKTGLAQLAFSGEVQNLTDERAYDVWGAQRPGRAFYFKTSLTY
ncbi:MAG TPA: TonB-dependent receptor plug domain-containing protein [Polyangiaceae bacterium]|nr:TonB-dependent receptor plug domain-containing protein [Polyangiaceae bacterium]